VPEWKQEIRRRLANLQLPPTREAAIVEELAQRLDESYAELLASGVSEADAYCQAHAELHDGELLTHGLRRVELRAATEPIILGTNRRTNYDCKPLARLALRRADVEEAARPHDEEAFQNCERDGASFSRLSELHVADEIITTAPGLPAPAVNVERRVASAESDAQSSPPPMIVEDRPNTQRQVTLDDLRRQKYQKSKRRSSPATSAEQLTLW